MRTKESDTPVARRVLKRLGTRRRLALDQLPWVQRTRLSRRDGIRALWERLIETFDWVRVDVEDVLEVEDGLLTEENVTYFHGRDGIEAQARSAWLITIRNGQQTSLTLYQTKQEALEAAGLREKEESPQGDTATPRESAAKNFGAPSS